MFFSSAVVSLALAASALATVFITNPVSSSSIPAGQTFTLSWQDSGTSPSLSSFGMATFAVYAGNANQQTLLQTLATHVDVSATSSVPCKVDSPIGPNSSEYFIRATSESLKNGQYYEEAFSAKFTLSGMTGSFNSSVQAQIKGQSTAPIGGPTASATGSGASASLTPTSSGSGASSTSTSSSSNGAIRPVMATGLVAVVATLLGASLL